MAPKKYRNFPIHVSPLNPDDQTYRVRVSNQVPGSLSSFDEKEVQTYKSEHFLYNKNGREVNLLEALANRRINDGQLYELGARLSDILLPGIIRERLEDSLRIVRERELGLRLRLVIESPELAALPWEYLYLNSSNGNRTSDLYFLALRDDVSIVRHAAIDVPEPKIDHRRKFRLVTAMAGPIDQVQLDLEAEYKAIEYMLEHVADIGPIQSELLENTTRQKLLAALREPTDLLHFSGHGYHDDQGGSIILEGKDQRSDFYSAVQFANLVRGAHPRMVILNACDTAQATGENPWRGVAQALVLAEVAAVVASQYRLKDVSAQPLAKEVYRSVLSGETVDQAVYNARQAIYQEFGLSQRDWGAPVLYLRVEDGIIFPTPLHTGEPDSEEKRATNVYVTQNIGTVEDGQVVGVSGAGQIGGHFSSEVTKNIAIHEIPRLSAPTLQVSLVGREDELEEAQERITLGGKIYLHGAFGIGKTSLASELFNRVRTKKEFTDGYLWGKNVGQMDAERALEWVASRLQESTVREANTRQDKIDALRTVLARRPNLLIGIDDVRDATVARAILEAAGDCPIILNGNRRLELAGLAEVRSLQPLKPADSEELFISLAFPSGRNLSKQEQDLLRLITKRMQYLPLAIKLAALKCAEGESLSTLAERIRVAPVTIIDGDKDLSIMFAILHEKLKDAPAAKSLLIRIASFPTLESPLLPLRQVQNSLDFFQAKDKLVALGIIDQPNPDRLALHPVLGIGVRRMEAEAVEVEIEHTNQWLLEFAEVNRDNYDELAIEHSNLSGLLDRFADQKRWDDLVILMGNLFYYLRVRGFWQENFKRLDMVLENPQVLQVQHNVGWAYLHRGIMNTLRNDMSAAESDLTHADQIFLEEDNLPYRGKTLYRWSSLSFMIGDLDLAAGQLEQALEWMGEEGFTHDRAGAHVRLAGILAIKGRREDAQTHFQQAIALGDPEIQARAYIALGGLARDAGDYPEARRHYDRALTLADQLGHLLQRAQLEQQIGYLHYYQGEYEQALDAFQEAQSIYQALEFRLGLAHIHHALGNIAFSRQEYDSAGEHYQNSLDLNREIGVEANVAYNLYQLGVVAQRNGEWSEAEEIYEQVYDVAVHMDDIGLQASTLFQKGTLAYEQGNKDQASLLIDKANTLASKVESHRVEARSLYYRGLIQAQEGHLESARETLAAAHALFVALNSVDAEKVSRILSRLEERKEIDESDLEDSIQDSGFVDVVLDAGVVEGEVLGVELYQTLEGGFVVAEEIDTIEDGGVVQGAYIGRLSRDLDVDSIENGGPVEFLPPKPNFDFADADDIDEIIDGGEFEAEDIGDE